MKIFALIAFTCLVAVPVVVSAEVYRWTNERGVVSFTDNRGNIPERFRSKAVLIDEQVPAVQEVIVDSGAKDKPGAEEKGDKKDAADKKKLFGGKDEATWKKEAERMNFEVTDTEKQIAEMRDRLSDPSKLSRTEYLSLQNTVKLLEQRLATKKSQQENFLDAARKAGAPL